MAQVLKPTRQNIEGLGIYRILPNDEKKMVGPFIFLDAMGPAAFDSGTGIDVKPHPHIGLATLTYLFEGSMLHQDSLRHSQEIYPGDVNWMVAGKGIVHSERESIETRNQPHKLYGLQAWVALPKDDAETDPSFTHVPKSSIPQIQLHKASARLVIGEAYGLKTNLPTYSPMFYVDISAQANASLERPDINDISNSECAIYIVRGQIEAGGKLYEQNQFVLLDDTDYKIEVAQNSRFIVIGGERWAQTPNLLWNFVSFDKNRLQKAKQDWERGVFGTIPSDPYERTDFPAKRY